MDTASVVKDHRFFTRDLSLDLQKLTSWTLSLDNDIRSEKINIGASKEMLDVYRDNPGGAGTALLSHYNIFEMGNSDLDILKQNINDALKEACVYYGIDYNSEEWYLHGWYNRNSKDGMWDVSPLDHEDKWHEHMNGVGAPVFHGYYCVNAEPSITVYQIFKNPNNIRVNVNKNNRMILSEVGHPHGMGNWRVDTDRITLAYDVAPRAYISDDDAQSWTRLN